MKTRSENELRCFLQDIADPMGIEVVEVKYKKGSNFQLTVYIDKDGGVDLSVCESFHKAINEPLDEFDPTFGASYTLNVSSLGLDWPLKTDRDFNKNLGEDVEFKLYAPLKGKKQFEGKLKAFDTNTITIEIDNEDTKFLRNQLAKITKLIRI